MKRSLALTGPQLAELAGVSLSTWAVHKTKGAPTPKNKRDLKAWVQRYAAWRKEQLMPGRGPGKAIVASDRRESEKWTAERQKWLAKRAEQIYLEQDGQLVRREEVIDAIATAIVVVKKRLGDARKKLSPRLYQAPSIEWIDNQLGAEFDAICEAFTHGMNNGIERPTPTEVDPAGPADPEGVGTEGAADGEPVG
jgi:hypothetical protein